MSLSGVLVDKKENKANEEKKDFMDNLDDLLTGGFSAIDKALEKEAKAEKDEEVKKKKILEEEESKNAKLKEQSNQKQKRKRKRYIEEEEEETFADIAPSAEYQILNPFLFMDDLEFFEQNFLSMDGSELERFANRLWPTNRRNN